MKKAGYYTVEATFIMAICTWIIVALCYSGLFIHDRIVIQTEANKDTVRWLSQEDSVSAKDWEKKMKKQWDRQLWLMKVKSVKAANYLFYEKVTITCELSLSFPLLKRILTQNKNQIEEKVEREIVVPAKYKWDVEKTGTS